MDEMTKRLGHIGHVLIAGSAVMTFMFGVSMFPHWLLALVAGLVLVCAAVGSAYMWPYVAAMLRDRRFVRAATLAPFAALFTLVDVTTNFGSIAWQRGSDLRFASHQDDKHSNSADEVAQRKASLVMARKQLDELMTRHAWAATANATQMRKNLQFAQDMAKAEASRGGCGRLCRGWERKAADISDKLANVEAKEDLTDRIEATERWLSKAKSEFAETPQSHSAAMLQNVSLASVFTLSLDPSKEAQHWTNTSVGWLVALFLTFGAMGCFLARELILGSSSLTRKTNSFNAKPNSVTQIPNVVREPQTKSLEFDRLRIKDLLGELKTA